MPRPRPLLLVVVVLGLLALAPLASAAGRNQILRDCEDDSKLQGSYTAAELRDARNNINSGLDAYSDCRDVLSAALARDARLRAAGAGGGGSTGGTGSGVTGGGVPGSTIAPAPGTPSPRTTLGSESTGPVLASPEDKAELEAARKAPPEVDVRGQKVVAGVSAVAGDPADASFPPSLIVVLAGLALTAIAAAVPVLRRRVLGRRAG